jgi:murein DD-endopeptidase MepM/ murein hydrolase activator NlpD
MELFEPWPVGYKVNRRSPYGPRVHPITGKRTFHHGVDVALPVGTPLTAPADGVVVHKNKTASAGFNLILRHEGTWHTVYYHLQKPSHLAVGDKVKAGDKIALSGNTGASTGPHLHWELRKSRKWGDTTDPMPYVVGPFVEYEPELVPEPVVPAPLPPGVPVNRPEPNPGHAHNSSANAARPKPKWEFSPALQRGFERIRRQAK